MTSEKLVLIVQPLRWNDFDVDGDSIITIDAGTKHAIFHALSFIWLEKSDLDHFWCSFFQ